ncbi:MAG: DMT family transporter [Hyphomicrobiales bacterium]
MTPARLPASRETVAKLACAFAGVAWGLFWLPLRAMDQAGIAGAWATVMIYLVPLVCAVPLLLWRWRAIAAGGWLMQMIGIVAGIALVLYADALIYTQVIKAMLLFYLTPLWSALLVRAVLGEAITPVRWGAMALGFAGMLVIFGADVGMPVPRTLGDWMGLGSGIFWAIAAVLLRIHGRAEAAVDNMLVYLFWGTAAAVVIALMPASGAHPPPDFDTAAAVLPWLVPVLMAIILPATLAIMWGTPLLNPAVVGLLFMTEISVGSATAAIWAGEPFGAREVLGIALITAAGLAESICEVITRRRSA